MTQFRFTATDEHGEVRSGTIEAETESDAVARLQQHGLSVVSVSAAGGREVTSVPPPLPPQAPPARSRAEQSAHAPIAASSVRGRKAASGNSLSLMLAGAALVVALAALGLELFRDPLGKGLGGYDMSSPEKALESLHEMELNQDIRAQIELSEIRNKKRLKEKIRTMDVKKEMSVEFEDEDDDDKEKTLKIVFYSFKQDGEKQYRTEGFVKDEETGYWLPKYVDPSKYAKDDAKVARQMDSWRRDGTLSDKDDGMGHGNGGAGRPWKGTAKEN